MKDEDDGISLTLLHDAEDAPPPPPYVSFTHETSDLHDECSAIRPASYRPAPLKSTRWCLQQLLTSTKSIPANHLLGKVGWNCHNETGNLLHRHEDSVPSLATSAATGRQPEAPSPAHCQLSNGRTLWPPRARGLQGSECNLNRVAV